MISASERKNLVQLCNFAGLQYCDPAHKDEFHRKGKLVLKYVARELGLAPDTYEIRSNKGGIAVSGEIVLHADNIYIFLSKDFDMSFYFRSCTSRKDYTGGTNHFLSWKEFRDDFEGCIEKFKLVMRFYGTGTTDCSNAAGN